MTNKEYFEKNGISFADAIKRYDEKKYGTLEKFLCAKNECEHKYNVGDVLVGKASGRVIVIYNICCGEYLYIIGDPSLQKRDGCCQEIDSWEFVKIGHSDLRFAVELGIIEDDDIG